MKKFENTGEDAEDLISIGTIGLIKAIESFQPNKGTKLATYAARCIENDILMSTVLLCKTLDQFQKVCSNHVKYERFGFRLPSSLSVDNCSSPL